MGQVLIETLPKMGFARKEEENWRLAWKNL